MEKIKQAYQQYFNSKPTLTARAPARVNLIGEHTDYNKGYVLPAAIDRYMNFAIGKNGDDSICRFRALDLNESAQISLSNLKKSKTTWSNYFIGILIQLRNQGVQLTGFDLIFGGNIPIGGGLSSSSALECGFLKLINEMFDLAMDNNQLINISQKSNHQFLGLQGGIMDQYAIMNSKAGHAILLNCDTYTSQHIKIDIKGHELMLIDSKVSHQLISSAYNDRVREGKEALRIIQSKYSEVNHLSMVTNNQLRAVKESLSSVIYNRVKFVIEENKRVHQFCKALQNNNIERLGQLLYDSHKGLKDEYEVSCPEMDLLVELAIKSKHVIGSRMIGGGFGGCTLNLIKSEYAKIATENIAKSYAESTGIEASIYRIKIVDGAIVSKLDYNK